MQYTIYNMYYKYIGRTFFDPQSQYSPGSNSRSMAPARPPRSPTTT